MAWLLEPSCLKISGTKARASLGSYKGAGRKLALESNRTNRFIATLGQLG